MSGVAATMASRERVVNTLLRRPTDRPPWIEIGFTTNLGDRMPCSNEIEFLRI